MPLRTNDKTTIGIQQNARNFDKMDLREGLGSPPYNTPGSSIGRAPDSGPDAGEQPGMDPNQNMGSPESGDSSNSDQDLVQAQSLRDDLEFYSWRELHKQKYAHDLIRNHDAVEQYWQSFNDKREDLYNFRKGKQWTDDELALLKEKKKTPVVFNKIINTIRTIVGTFIQNKYDVKPAPVEPTSQDISDVFTNLYHYTNYHNNCDHLDADMIQNALIGGIAWQENWIEMVPGEKPRIQSRNQNTFAIYPDPNSMDLINRSDLQFIDRASWLNLGELIEAFPEHSGMLNDRLKSYEVYTDGHYEPINRFADRSHQNKWERNGRFKVIERFYKVKRKHFIAIESETMEQFDVGYDLSTDAVSEIEFKFPKMQIIRKMEEYLYLAVAIPVFEVNQFLFNGPYHCQPRDPRTKAIMFPLTDLVCESVGGEVNGFVEYMIGPQKIINSMMGNKLHSAKHATNTSLVGRKDAFDEDDKRDIEEHHSDGDRTFWVKAGQDPASAMSLLPQGSTNPDTDGALNYATAFEEEVSSTPPAMKGLSEGNVAGVLNEQRIQQSFVQLQGFVKNYMHFLQRRAKLWMYYWQTYYTEEEVFKVTKKQHPDSPEYFKVNEVAVDEYGELAIKNDITAGEYDMVIEDSYQSPTVRDKVRQQIIELQNSPSIQQDPVLNTMLTMYFLKMSDAPQDLKDYAIKHSAIVAQEQKRLAQQEQKMAEQQAQQGKQNMQETELNQAEQRQRIAQTEAEQTFDPENFPPTQVPDQSANIQIPRPQSAVSEQGF